MYTLELPHKQFQCVPTRIKDICCRYTLELPHWQFQWVPTIYVFSINEFHRLSSALQQKSREKVGITIWKK